MIEITEDNKSKFSTERSYQNKPIVNSLDNLYGHLDLELRDMKKSLETIFSCIERLRNSIYEIDKNKKDFAALHSTLERSQEICNSLLKSLIHLTEDQNIEYVYWIEGEYKFSKTDKEN